MNELKQCLVTAFLSLKHGHNLDFLLTIGGNWSRLQNRLVSNHSRFFVYIMRKISLFAMDQGKVEPLNGPHPKIKRKLSLLTKLFFLSRARLINSPYWFPYILLMLVVRIWCYNETVSPSWWFSVFVSPVSMIAYLYCKEKLDIDKLLGTKGPQVAIETFQIWIFVVMTIFVLCYHHGNCRCDSLKRALWWTSVLV